MKKKMLIIINIQIIILSAHKHTLTRLDNFPSVCHIHTNTHTLMQNFQPVTAKNWENLTTGFQDTTVASNRIVYFRMNLMLHYQ